VSFDDAAVAAVFMVYPAGLDKEPSSSKTAGIADGLVL
jgi:hypothetical protein